MTTLPRHHRVLLAGALLACLWQLAGCAHSSRPAAAEPVAVAPPGPRAAAPSTSPACTAQNVGECALLCQQGDGRCCNDVGTFYERGQGVPVDLARACELFARGCELGNGLGCRNLGVMHEHGKGVTRDEARAVALYRRACDMQEPRGCYSLANCYSKGTGLAADKARAQALFASACGDGVGAACNNEGWLWFSGDGLAKDLARGAGLFERACELGDANGCSSAGWALATGAGVAEDRARGIELLQKGCRGGNAWGCTKQQALCDQGGGRACAALADHYRSGAGVARDEAKARALQRRACELGLEAACDRPAPPPTAPPSPPAGPSPGAGAASPWQAACRAHAAYRELRWTASVTERVEEGRVTSKGKRTLALERDGLTGLVRKVDPGDAKKLLALQKKLLAAIAKAPRYDNPVPAHLGGGADMLVSDALRRQLDRFWQAVAEAAAAHGVTCPGG